MPRDTHHRRQATWSHGSRTEHPHALAGRAFAALLVLVAAGLGCDRLLGRLGREQIKSMVDRHSDFSPIVGAGLRRPTEATVSAGILEGLWKLRGGGLAGSTVVLKPRGLAVFRSVRPGGDESLIVELRTPLKRHVVSITGVKDVGKIRKEAEFTWALDEGVPPVVARLTVAAFGTAVQNGRADFERFDDGWRLVKLDAPLPSLPPFSLEMVDPKAFAEATREGVAEMSAQAVGTWSGRAMGGPVKLRLAAAPGGKLGGELEYACAKSRLWLGDGSDPDALVLEQQTLEDTCDSLRGLHIHMQMESQVALSLDEGKATLRWRQNQLGNPTVVGEADLVKTASSATPPEAAPPAAPPREAAAGIHLLVMRPRCCATAGWQQDLARVLGARGVAAFPGTVLAEGRIARKASFESRLDDMVIGPIAPSDLERFLADLPGLVTPLAARLGDGPDIAVQGDRQQAFQIGMYQFQVIRP